MKDSPIPYTLHPVTNNAEKEAIYRFRFDIFGREMGLLGPIELWAEPSFHDELDDLSQHFFAEIDSKIVGSIRITDGEPCVKTLKFLETYDIEKFLEFLPASKVAVATRLLVDARFRGSRLGFHLIKQTAEYCLDKGIECVFLDCQPHLVPLYQRFGFRPYRGIFNDPYVGVMVPLVLIVSDFEHLLQIHSPFIKMLSERDLQPNPNLVQSLRSLINPLSAVVAEEIQGDEFFLETVNSYLNVVEDSDKDRSVLSGLSPEDINTLVLGSYMLRTQQGDVVIRQNHATRTMFLVIDGVLECRKADQVIGFIGKGDVVGEFAYLADVPRTADVVVVSESATLLAFEKKHISRLIETNSRLAAHCLFNLSRSLCFKLIR